MKVIFIATLFFLFASALTESGGKVTWKDCSSTDDKTRMEIKSFQITPNPIQKGKKVDIDVELDLKEELTSGEISVKVNYGVIPIVDESLDLCDLITQINYQCPASKGSFPIKTSQIIPSYIPSGSYEANATVIDQNNKELLCFSAQLNLN